MALGFKRLIVLVHGAVFSPPHGTSVEKSAQCLTSDSVGSFWVPFFSVSLPCLGDSGQTSVCRRGFNLAVSEDAITQWRISKSKCWYRFTLSLWLWWPNRLLFFFFFVIVVKWSYKQLETRLSGRKYINLSAPSPLKWSHVSLFNVCDVLI